MEVPMDAGAESKDGEQIMLRRCVLVQACDDMAGDKPSTRALMMMHLLKLLLDLNPDVVDPEFRMDPGSLKEPNDRNRKVEKSPLISDNHQVTTHDSYAERLQQLAPLLHQLHFSSGHLHHHSL